MGREGPVCHLARGSPVERQPSMIPKWSLECPSSSPHFIAGANLRYLGLTLQSSLFNLSPALPWSGHFVLDLCSSPLPFKFGNKLNKPHYQELTGFQNDNSFTSELISTQNLRLIFFFKVKFRSSCVLRLLFSCFTADTTSYLQPDPWPSNCRIKTYL